MWETVVSNSRDIAALCGAFAPHIGVRRLRRICCLMSAFSICLARHACGARPKHQLSLKRLLSEEQLGLVNASSCPPGRVAQLLLAETTQIPDSAQALFTNRERSTLNAAVAKLTGTIGQCERLVQTPIPQSYVRHTSRFLSLWLLTLPLGLCQTVGWWTPLVVWMASWSLCGIQELGQVIEHPFDGPQSLRLAVMSNTVHASMTDALQAVASLRATGLLRRILWRNLAEEELVFVPPETIDTVDEVLGRTALHHAAYVGNRRVVEMLVAAGADANVVDAWDGSTPLDVARARNHIAVAQCLMDAGGTSALFGQSKEPVPWVRFAAARVVAP